MSDIQLSTHTTWTQGYQSEAGSILIQLLHGAGRSNTWAKGAALFLRDIICLTWTAPLRKALYSYCGMCRNLWFAPFPFATAMR